MGKELVVEELTENCFAGKDIDIALFSAGGGTSLHYAPFFAKAGIVVIDNSARGACIRTCRWSCPR